MNTIELFAIAVVVERLTELLMVIFQWFCEWANRNKLKDQQQISNPILTTISGDSCLKTWLSFSFSMLVSLLITTFCCLNALDTKIQTIGQVGTGVLAAILSHIVHQVVQMLINFQHLLKNLSYKIVVNNSNSQASHPNEQQHSNP